MILMEQSSILTIFSKKRITVKKIRPVQDLYLLLSIFFSVHRLRLLSQSRSRVYSSISSFFSSFHRLDCIWFLVVISWTFRSSLDLFRASLFRGFRSARSTGGGLSSSCMHLFSFVVSLTSFRFDPSSVLIFKADVWMVGGDTLPVFSSEVRSSPRISQASSLAFACRSSVEFDSTVSG